MNWTEILEKGGVPDSPGYQELLQQIKEERLCQPVDNVQPKKRGRKRK